jgi:hypothetical protein
MISGFCHNADEICTLLGYYAALNGNPLPMFQDNISVPLSQVKKSKTLLGLGPLKMGLIHCPKMLAKDYHWMLRNTAEERRSQLKEMLVCKNNIRNYLCQKQELF